MKQRNWVWLGGGVMALAVLAGASYVAVSLIFTGSLGLGGDSPSQRQGYRVIQPTEVPARLPDMVGPVVEVQDQSFVVQSNSKGSVEQNGPRTEIVIAADTKVYEDITSRDTSAVVDGQLQMRVAPYAYNQIKVGDLLSVWGDQRGDRLVAQAVIVHVSAPATPAP